MSKFIVLALTFLFITPAFASKACKVYGITDGPQKLFCRFPDKNVALSCHDGKYFLNQTPVTVAFHLEVESGAVPLVFKSPDMTLTVLLDDPIEAELVSSKIELKGHCKRLP